jgi:hypothetical protein
MGGSTLIAMAHTRNLSVVMARPIPWYGFFGPPLRSVSAREYITRSHTIDAGRILLPTLAPFAVRPRSHDY